MRVLLTNHELARRTGTELLTAELAAALRARGHEVAVFTWMKGALAEALAADGVPVVDDPRQAPFAPEIIHGQHHLATMAALTAWPGAPALFFCHGVRPFDEHPPRHPRIGLYLSMAAVNADWVAATAQVPADRVATMPNWFDAARFTTVRDTASPVGRAAVFSNRLAPGPAWEALQAGCARGGLTLDGIGQGFGTATDSPESVLPGYEVVFASGRSALEALACGCAVVPFDLVSGVGDLVTPEDFDPQRDRNWCVFRRPTDVTAEAVEAPLARRTREGTAEVTRRVRTELTLERAAAALEAHYGRVLKDWAVPGSPAVAASARREARAEETEALVGYLRFLAARTRECDAAFVEARREARQAAKLPAVREELAGVRRDLRGLIRRLERSWWGRRLLRRHGGWQNPPVP